MIISEEVAEKAKKIQAIFFDVDGVLTDGSITYSSSGEELKSFQVKDGQIVKYLRDYVILGAITGRSSEAVKRRCKELNLDFFEQGVINKWSMVAQKMKQYHLSAEAVCYIGDDIIDMETIRHVGLGVSPKDARPYVREIADYVTRAKGGKGVFREVADLILETKGILPKLLKDIANG